MSPEMTGIVGIGILLLLLALKMQIGLSMLLVGVIGFAYLSNTKAALVKLAMETFATASVYSLSVIPLFALMGLFLFHAGLGREIFKSLDAWLGRVRGGLAMATIGACGVFGALSGSIIATVATMTSVALPEMRRYKYKDILSTGSIAGGAGVDILIPPSTVLVLYGILTEESIGKLLIAGILPGILLAVLFIIAIYAWVKIRPDIAPVLSRERVTILSKVKLSARLYPVVILFCLTMGGLYLGFFTATEAAAVGAFGALVFSLITKNLGWKGFTGALGETTSVTAMLFLVLIGANMFGRFISISKIPMELAAFVAGLDISVYLIMAGIYLFYIILGCFLEGLAILALTVPIVHPLVISLGFDGIWFGVVLIIMISIGTVTPPVGICVFVTASVAPDVPISTIFKGAVPFLLAKILLAVILTAFPQVVMFLPGLMR